MNSEAHKNREALKCVSEMIDYLCTLNGFDDWWYNLDDEVEEEIETKLREIVKKRLSKVTNRGEILENLIDLSDDEIKSDYYSWDKGDCSEIGLCEILLKQLIKSHKVDNGDYYDTDYDNIKLRY